jgi:hypothetical protein
MRLLPVLALMTSSFALAACGGGGSGMSLLQGGNVVGGTKDASAAAIVAANGFQVCTINQKGCIPITGNDGTVVTVKDTDGDGIPDGKDGTDGDGNTGSGAGGNATTYVAGNKTIALEAFVLDKPTTAGTVAISQITSTLTPTFAATETAVMSGTKPKTLKFTIDTKSANNSNWAIPAEMPEDVLATRDLRWIEHGHINAATASFNVRDTAGNPVVYSAAKQGFLYTVDHIASDGRHRPGDVVEHFNSDFYWNQIKVYMGSKANGGSKDKYREYWIKNSDTTINRDETLQVWNWNDSYSVDYHNDIGGGNSKQTAWSFGGKAATNMQASGKARYDGRYVGTAKAAGWLKQDGATIDPNVAWMVQGRSEVLADFDNSSIHGTLSPESWTSEQDKKWYTWYTSEATVGKPGDQNHAASVGTAAAPDYYQIYGSKIILDGKIVASPPTTTGGTPVKNVFEGTAKLDGRFTSGDNPMYGGFFGTDGKEVTGIFNVNGTTKELVGGSTGNTNEKEATLTVNGSFNAQCVASPGFTCPP